MNSSVRPLASCVELALYQRRPVGSCLSIGMALAVLPACIALSNAGLIVEVSEWNAWLDDSAVSILSGILRPIFVVRDKHIRQR